MDLFLINGAAQSKSSTAFIVYATVAALSLYGLSKLFNFLRDSDKDQEQDQDQPDNKPAGIYNEGNTCFVNSLLQALSSLKSFHNLLQQTASNFRGQLDPNEQFIVELASVLQEINNSSQSISVSRLLSAIQGVKEGLINLQQQDAHQLYAAIITCVDNALNRQKNLDLSSTRFNQEQEFENPLIGYLKSSTVCMTCKSETSVKIDPFYDLSLDISKMYVIDVHSALAQFQREERIDHWTCSNCSITNHCRKLKKAMGMLKGKNKEKLNFIGQAIVDFLESQNLQENEIKEVNLKLEDFVKIYTEEYEAMSSDPERDQIFIQMEGQQSSILKRTIITKFPKILVIHMKQLVVHPYTGDIVLLKKHIGFDQTLQLPNKKRPNSWKLTGLLTHIGNESFGHYLSFRRLNQQSNQWYVVSDSMSQKSTWNAVQQSRAYMLFYEAN